MKQKQDAFTEKQIQPINEREDKKFQESKDAKKNMSERRPIIWGGGRGPHIYIFMLYYISLISIVFWHACVWATPLQIIDLPTPMPKKISTFNLIEILATMDQSSIVHDWRLLLISFSDKKSKDESQKIK